MTTKRLRWIQNALLAGGVAMAAWPAAAAEVTPERLIHADKEPQNWLMNHRTYDGQRYSPLDHINTGNVKGLSSVARLKVAKGRYQLFVSGFNYIAYENIIDVAADVTTRAKLMAEPGGQEDYR
jgi:hypothetical protein